MKNFIIKSIIILFALSMFGLSAEELRNKKLGPAVTVVESGTDEEGNIWMGVWHLFINEPISYMEQAIDDFKNEDYLESAENIYRASAFIQLKSTRAKGQMKKSLLKIAQELDTLGNKVESLDVEEVEELEKLFAKSNKILAAYHSDSAKKAKNEGLLKKAGKEMKAAGNYLDYAFKWWGKKVKDTSKSLIEKAKKVGEKFSKGEKSKANEFDDIIDDFDSELDDSSYWDNTQE